MRATRLIALMLHLQVRGQVGAAELARRLEVSERTVQRDVLALTTAGVPVTTVRGPAGGYRLDGGYRTRLTGVGLDEAAALAFVGLSGPAEQLGLGDVLETAQFKVWAALTGEARDRAQGTAERFHLDPVRWYGTAEPVPHLADIAQAVWGDRQVRLTYLSRGVPTTRVVDPLGLVLAAGDWYLVALRDGDRRTYRVSRVQEVEILDTPAHRPDRFDLATTWRTARRAVEAEHRLVEVSLRITSAALPRLRRVVAVVGQSRVPVEAAGQDDGRPGGHPSDPVLQPDRTVVELTVPFETETWARMALLGLGGDVEVLAPPTLRSAMAAETARMAATYSAAPDADAATLSAPRPP